MYESLVAEYLEYPVPAYVTRSGGPAQLPKPHRNNVIHSIIGARRCGKTYRLYQLMDELVQAGVPRRLIFYFPFDDDRLDTLDQTCATTVLESYYRLVPEARDGCYLLFDEIQDAPNWAAFVRRVAEQHKTTCVITGSSSKLLSTDIPTKLRGRSLVTEVWPLSFDEFCAFGGIEPHAWQGAYTSKERSVRETALDRYLEVGGFPAVQGMIPTDRTRMLQAYADEIVTKDVLERFGTTSYRVGRRFARSILRSTGLKFSVNKQVNALRSAGLSISNEAAYALLDDFEDAHLAFKVASYSLSIRDNPKSSYKVYAVDQGLALAVAPASHFDLGQRLETAVFIELKRRYGTNRDDVIATYSSPACPEVDFVVGDVLLSAEHELVQVAVESGAARMGEGTAPDKKYQSEVGNLVTAMGETGLSTSTLVTRREEGEIRTETGVVRVVPAWRWLLED